MNNKFNFINELKEEDVIKEVYAIKDIKIKQTRGKDFFIDILLFDKTGLISGKIWNADHTTFDKILAMECIEIKGKVSNYNNSLYLTISEWSTPLDKIDWSYYVKESQLNIKSLTENLKRLLLTIEDPFLKELTNLILKHDKILNSFVKAPAASSMHHAYLGGLLEHSLSVGRMADAIAPLHTDLNRDLLVFSAIFHDIGKIHEFEFKLNIKYSDKGMLIGHSVLGYQLIASMIKKVKSKDKELALKVLHIILSHHGKLEYGASKEPMIGEAVAINYLDELDSKMNAFKTERNKPENKNRSWSDYSKMFNKKLFLGYKEKNI